MKVKIIIDSEEGVQNLKDKLKEKLIYLRALLDNDKINNDLYINDEDNEHIKDVIARRDEINSQISELEELKFIVYLSGDSGKVEIDVDVGSKVACCLY